MKVSPPTLHTPSPTSTINRQQIKCRLMRVILLWEKDVLKHYAEYFSILEALKVGHQRTRRIISTCCHLLLFSALYIGQFYLTQDGMSDTENMAMYNVVYLNGFESPWNLAISVFILYARYLFTLMYCNNNGPSSVLIYELVVQGDGKFFGQRVYTKYRPLNDKEACDVNKLVVKIQVTAVILRQSFQIAFACNYLNFLWCQFIVTRHFYQHQLLLKNAFSYLQFQISLVIGTLITRLFVHSVVQTATFAVLVMNACSLRLSQLQQLIARTKPEEIDALWLRRFFALNNQFLVLLYDINRIYGRALYASVVVGLPANALLIFIMAFHRLSLLLQVILALSGTLTVFFIFGVHLKVALIATKLHCPAKKLMVVMAGWSCSGGQQKVGSLRLKLKTQRYVEQFYTTNQHTVTYGKFGKVTVRSFSRHLLYYTKMLIFSYGLLRNSALLMIKFK